MRFADVSRGRPFAKDPAVARFDGRYWRCDTLPPFGDGQAGDGYAIGIAVSDDGLTWSRLSDAPFLPGGPAGAWDASESGHPYLFTDTDGSTHLFFPGNDDDGATWYLARAVIGWRDGLPHLDHPEDAPPRG